MHPSTWTGVSEKNVITGEETWMFQKDPGTENKVSCGQRIAFLTEEDKITTFRRAKNFDGVFDVKGISHEDNIPGVQKDNPTSRKTLWSVWKRKPGRHRRQSYGATCGFFTTTTLHIQRLQRGILWPKASHSNGPPVPRFLRLFSATKN